MYTLGKDTGLPSLAVSLEGKTLALESIEDRVEEEGAWWEWELVSKMHYQVTMEDGRRSW